MATQDAPNREIGAPHHAVAFDRFFGILAAGGRKPATGAQHRTDCGLVEANHCHNECDCEPMNNPAAIRIGGFAGFFSLFLQFVSIRALVGADHPILLYS